MTVSQQNTPLTPKFDVGLGSLSGLLSPTGTTSSRCDWFSLVMLVLFVSMGYIDAFYILVLYSDLASSCCGLLSLTALLA